MDHTSLTPVLGRAFRTHVGGSVRTSDDVAGEVGDRAAHDLGSCSSRRICLRTSRSSADSSRVAPDGWPSSVSACSTQFFTQLCGIPKSLAIRGQRDLTLAGDRDYVAAEPEMMNPLALDPAADKISVTVTCRVLEFSPASVLYIKKMSCPAT